jgi:polysaccharide chain length determinant protein (PEP-CTERM system associated)
MNEIYRQLIVILHGIWQRRWYALATAWAVTLAGWGVVATMPDQYDSSARVYIDTQSSLQPLMEGLAVDTNPLEQITMMQRTLLSRPNLERVVRMTDMDLSARSDAQMQRIVDRLSRDVSIQSEGGNLFRISYTSEDPQQAEAVVQALLTIFVEGNLGESRTDLASAQNFIDKQLRAYEKQLEAIERKRAEFRRKNRGDLPGDGNYFEQLENAEDELAKLQKEYENAKIGREQLAKQMKNVPRYLELTTPVGPGGAGGGGAPRAGRHAWPRRGRRRRPPASGSPRNRGASTAIRGPRGAAPPTPRPPPAPWRPRGRRRPNAPRRRVGSGRR